MTRLTEATRNAWVWLVVALALVGLGFERLHSLSARLAKQENAGCVRQNAGIRAVVDLGQIIKLARASVQDPATTQAAQQDYLAVYKLVAPASSSTGRALRDIALLVGGQSQKPLDYRPLLRAEDDYLQATAIAAPPRPCPKP